MKEYGQKKMSENKKNPAVDHPIHYSMISAKCEKCGEEIECIDVVRHMNFNLGNALKYIWRSDFKGDPVENLEKAIWYLRDEIKLIIDQSAMQDRK